MVHTGAPLTPDARYHVGGRRRAVQRPVEILGVHVGAADPQRLRLDLRCAASAAREYHGRER